MLDRRVVLIGTPESLAGLAAQLAPVPTSEAEVLGTVVLSPADAAAASALPLPLLGSVDDLPRLHARFGFRGAIVSIPSVMSAAAARVRSALAALSVAERNAPTIHDVLRGAASGGATGTNGHDTGAMRALLAPGAGIDFAALIGRPSRRLNEPAARAVLGGKRILITGAGGSIGSELARLCAALEPSCLILMDRAENPLFEIDREIKARFPHVSRQTVLHDVVDAEATLRRLVALRPDVVFHAAAHKHVPMMEDHPGAAITNNLFGTKSIADAALAVGAERFVMVSTDKAVHPTSVMGATKRLAELYIRSLNRSRGGGGRAGAGTKFSLVRFGNVLGSACSVLPIWARQIAEGGPVTVTDPRMTRYFMTIPEAATLVIHAGTLARSESGERDVFVLDMGEPIKIIDLADRFVRSMGLSPRFPVSLGRSEAAPGPAIRISVTGARPGEKLHEELAYPAEELSPTEADGVMAWSGDDRDEIDPGFITRMIAELSAVRAAQDAVVVQRVIANYVQTLNRSSTDATFQTVAA
jgi:FlaA1/EpsC-like NDP-sugar epimerase